MNIIKRTKRGESVSVVDWSLMFKKHKGMWVALKDDEKTIIASDKNPKIVKEKASKKGFDRPIIIRIPLKLTPHIG